LAILENCPTCENATSENASICPACGEPLQDGWVNIVQEERQRKIDERIRLEEEQKANAKKAKYKIWKILFKLIIGVCLYIVISDWYDGYQIQDLKENNPEEYQKLIEKLKAEVAKVPVEDYNKNIELYKDLNDLDPENELYISKIYFYEKKSEEAFSLSIKAKKKLEEQEKLAKIKVEAIAEAEKRRKGHHCLSSWDGSHRSVKRYVESNLKDPDSFEHIATSITPVNERGTHTLSMRYRAKNGFGGVTTGLAIATIQNSGCLATITSIN